MKHRIEIYSAGCKTCREAIATVCNLAGFEHEVVVHDMHQDHIAKRAAELGIRSLPAVVIDGKLAGCGADGGIDEYAIHEALRQTVTIALRSRDGVHGN